jgi:hypothetical protein
VLCGAASEVARAILFLAYAIFFWCLPFCVCYCVRDGVLVFLLRILVFKTYLEN